MAGQLVQIGPGETVRSQQLYEEARDWIPNGAQGEGKYYPPYPHYWKKAAGSRMWDVDGNEYLDYWCAAGPAVLGHNHPAVRDAVKRTLDETGVLFAGPYPGELELAKAIHRHVPGAEMAGFGCGGSDAVVYALRAARAYTGRTKILRFEGSWHGWYDGVLFSVDPKMDELTDGVYEPIAESEGLPPESRNNVVVCPYNDADHFERVVRQEREQLAAVIVEPISHTMGVVAPVPGFLERLRELCDAYDIPLVYDEIITGFRHALKGAQGLLGVTPDMTAFGKAMSNGFPISAVVGKRKYIEQLTPQGKAVFSGTFNGNPVCVSAALATIEVLEREKIHERLFSLGEMMADGINEHAQRSNVRAHCVNYGSVWSVYFTDHPIRSYRDLLTHHNADASQAFVRAMWTKGIYAKPKYANRWYLSAAHTAEDVERTVEAVGRFFADEKSALRTVLRSPVQSGA